MDSQTCGIPTIGEKGIRFRSRIEAQWASMFTKLKWEWEYEPFDLKGYIPDFILKFPAGHVLVEVKGTTDMKSLKKYVKKIVDSGWDGYFLIVCSVIEKESDPFNESVIIGWMGFVDEDGGFGFRLSSYIEPPKKRYWRKPCKIAIDEFATLTKCDKCKNYTFFDHMQGWTCKYCGYHDKSICGNASDISFTSIEKMWMECKNKVQWKK